MFNDHEELEFLTSRIFETSEFLMSQFMLIISQQFLDRMALLSVGSDQRWRQYTYDRRLDAWKGRKPAAIIDNSCIVI